MSSNSSTPSSYNTTYSFMSFMNENANLSLKGMDEMCLLAYSFRERWDVILINVMNTFIGALTLLLLYVLCNCREVMKIWSILGKDLKVIIFTGFMFYVTASVNASLFFCYNTLILFTNMQPCSYIWSGLDCFNFQLPYWTIYVKGYFSFHLALFIERAFVTFVSTKSKYKVGYFTSIIMFFSLISFAMSSNTQTYINDRVFCFSSTTVIDSKVNLSVLWTIAEDFSITICEFLLLLWNKHRVEKYKKQILSFNLEDKFKLREIRLSISVIYPYSLVHSLGYCFQMYAYVWYAQQAQSLSLQDGVFLYGCVNFVRLMCSFTSLAFLLIYTKVRARQSNVLWAKDANGMEEHFKEFRRIIS